MKPRSTHNVFALDSNYSTKFSPPPTTKWRNLTCKHTEHSKIKLYVIAAHSHKTAEIIYPSIIIITGFLRQMACEIQFENVFLYLRSTPEAISNSEEILISSHENCSRH